MNIDLAVRPIRASMVAAVSALAVASALAAPKPRVNDFPTVERVLYVESCMQQHPGPAFEMRNKCACAIDKIASQVPFRDYEHMMTASNAVSIGGERGGYIRDTKALTDEIKRFRDMQTAAKKGCFIDVDAK